MNQLRNKNININTQIKFIKSKSYFDLKTYNELKLLRNIVQKSLNKQKGIITNNATGFQAKITRATIDKIIKPTPNFNPFNSRYIDNLNAACYLNVLFENAVYLDTLKPMKQKTNNVNELGYHHFVAPLKMNGFCYKAFITVREKVNSKILYVVSVTLFQFDYILDKISVKELIDDTSIWNYELNSYNYYNYFDFIAENLDFKFIWIVN